MTVQFCLHKMRCPWTPRIYTRGAAPGRAESRELELRPLDSLHLWGLRSPNHCSLGAAPTYSALGVCDPKPLQWLRFLISISHPLIFIGNYPCILLGQTWDQQIIISRTPSHFKVKKRNQTKATSLVLKGRRKFPRGGHALFI